MLKDEMKNRISMALKDQVLQQGFEIICKENTELKERQAEIIEVFTSASSGDDFEMAESAREIMEILNIPCYRHGKVTSKLTQAKEIIKELLDTQSRLDPYRNIFKGRILKAEQFLQGII